MSKGLNRLEIIGNLGADPQVRATESGDKVANVNIAATEKWKDRDGQDRERTEWIRLVFWAGLADVAEKHLKKGQQIYVAGTLRGREYEDSDGVTKWWVECHVRELLMLSQAYGNGGPRQPPPPADATDLDDEIPL